VAVGGYRSGVGWNDGTFWVFGTGGRVARLLHVR